MQQSRLDNRKTFRPNRAQRRKSERIARKGPGAARKTIAALTVAACLASSAAAASSSFEGRAIDGSGNNIAVPTLGSAPGLYARLDYGPSNPFRNAYDDGLGLPARPDGPNTRLVSNVLSDQNGSIPEPLGLNDFAAWWLFHVHVDIAVGAQSPIDASIEVPADDPVFDPNGSIDFRRSLSSIELGLPLPFPTREIINAPTAFLDNNPIYQTNALDAAAVREGTGGRLKLQPTASGELVMPSVEYVRNTPGGAGSFLDPLAPVPFPVSLAVPTSRGAFPPGAAIATVLMREHNRVADALTALSTDKQASLGIPDVSVDAGAHDDAVFELARAIVEAELQAITYDEVLPAMGIDLPAYSGYEPTVDPTPLIEFASGPLRLHTMLNAAAPRVLADGSSVGEVDNAAVFAFGVPGSIYAQFSQAGMDSILRGMLVTPAQRHDLQLVDGLRNINPQVDLGVVGDLNDLMATHIERGRDRGVPAYGEIRQALGLTPAATFADVTSDVDVQADLASLYGSVADLDPLVGMLAEDRQPGSLFGETAMALYELQFVATRDGDRLWHQERLEDSTFRQAVRAVGIGLERDNGRWTLDRSLAGLLRDTTSIGARGDVARLKGNTDALLVQD